MACSLGTFFACKSDHEYLLEFFDIGSSILDDGAVGPNVFFAELTLTELDKHAIREHGRCSRFQLYAAQSVQLLTDLCLKFRTEGTRSHNPSQWTELILDFMSFYLPFENVRHRNRHRTHASADVALRLQDSVAQKTPTACLVVEDEFLYYDITEYLLRALLNFATHRSPDFLSCRYTAEVVPLIF